MIQNKHAFYISIILSFFLIICLFRMPYGYYELMRFIAMVSFILLAVYEHQNKNDLLKIIFIFLALLFQPFMKISLGRDLWNTVDVILAVFLVYIAFSRYRKDKINKISAN